MSVAILNRMVGVCFLKKVKLEQRLDRGQELKRSGRKPKVNVKALRKECFQSLSKRSYGWPEGTEGDCSRKRVRYVLSMYRV